MDSCVGMWANRDTFLLGVERGERIKCGSAKMRKSSCIYCESRKGKYAQFELPGKFMKVN